MEIAINKCFGGFSLSDALYERLIELGIPLYTKWDDLPKDGKPWIIRSDNKLLGGYYSNFNDEEKRTHPILIQAIKELGEEKSSGPLGRIKIVEIPDGINYEINDYDGMETIHEAHRSW